MKYLLDAGNRRIENETAVAAPNNARPRGMRVNSVRSKLIIFSNQSIGSNPAFRALEPQIKLLNYARIPFCLLVWAAATPLVRSHSSI